MAQKHYIFDQANPLMYAVSSQAHSVPGIAPGAVLVAVSACRCQAVFRGSRCSICAHGSSQLTLALLHPRVTLPTQSSSASMVAQRLGFGVPW